MAESRICFEVPARGHGQPTRQIPSQSMPAKAGRRNALIELTNKAKEAGANAVVVTSKTSSKAGIKISGHALDCVNLN